MACRLPLDAWLKVTEFYPIDSEVLGAFPPKWRGQLQNHKVITLSLWKSMVEAYQHRSFQPSPQTMGPNQKVKLETLGKSLELVNARTLVLEAPPVNSRTCFGYRSLGQTLKHVLQMCLSLKHLQLDLRSVGLDLAGAGLPLGLEGLTLDVPDASQLMGKGTSAAGKGGGKGMDAAGKGGGKGMDAAGKGGGKGMDAAGKGGGKGTDAVGKGGGKGKGAVGKGFGKGTDAMGKGLGKGTVFAVELEHWMCTLEQMTALRSLTLTVGLPHSAELDSGLTQRVVTAVLTMPELHTLALTLWPKTNADDVKALGQLSTAPRLEVLTLTLPECTAPAGLAALQHCDSLRRLQLELAGSHFSNEDVQWLVALSTARRLRSLQYGLAQCGLGSQAVQALFSLCDGSTLEALRLDLGGNTVGSPPPSLPVTSSLCTLSVEFAPGDADDSVVATLSVLNCWPCLQTLTLVLPGAITTVGACLDLADLRHCATLQCLKLELRNSSIGTGGARALASLWAAPGLRELHLGLAACGVSVAGAQALAELRKSTSLHSLHLDLTQNEIATLGAEALSSLSAALTLERLTLLLAHNGIGYEGADHLQRLRTPWLGPGLTVDLEGNPVNVWQ